MTNAWMLKLSADEFRRKEAEATKPHYTPPKLDPVVEANRLRLHRRSQVGIAKYGKTLDEGRYSERELICHALDEALDLANYLQAQLQRHDRERDDGK